ncbi:zinc finger protein CONSTANS-LIKE 6-like [Aristolochia californica]|uniref:zinc finger protein CONSTANS-LIKE 6-like n=1 Tax=Aristolochia californica TaxID=171875 RepID=UPI0035D73B42
MPEPGVPSIHNPLDEMGTLDELEGILSIKEEEEKHYMNWDCFGWGEFCKGVFKEEMEEVEYELEEDDEESGEKTKRVECLEKFDNGNASEKKEIVGFWEEEKSISLNLNYQDVMDAWSDRHSPWASEDYCFPMTDDCFMGQVPIMEEEKTKREARVMRYKEKRQSRLFSKKIRYQVRKLNAEKRPRLKGRFVKRSESQTKTLK